MDYTLLPPEPEEPQLPQRDDTEDFLEAVDAKITRYLSPYAPNTVSGYKADIQTFFHYVRKDLKRVTKDDIFAYLQALERDGFRPATVNRKMYSLTKIFDLYLELNLVRENPVRAADATSTLKRPEKRHIQLSITYEDIQRVIERAHPKTSIIVKTLVNTGLRVSELIGIRKDRFEPYSTEYLQISINGKGGKERTIYLSFDLYEQIKEHFDSESIYLFSSATGQQLSRINLYTQVRRAFKRHTGKDSSPHQLRHFFSTYKIGVEKQDVKSVSRYLGHSRISITLDMYTHTTLTPDETHIF